jgi:hypothetical protein
LINVLLTFWNTSSPSWIKPSSRIARAVGENKPSAAFSPNALSFPAECSPHSEAIFY